VKKRWRVVVQGAVTVLVVAFVARAVARNWDDFRSMDVTLHLRADWLVVSVASTFFTYLLQIESWRRVLAGWRQSIGFVPAARAWCLANLGRYVPGKVWSVAGLVVMARQRGVEGWAAAASAVVMQALGLGTCLAVVTMTLPGRLPGLVLGGGLVIVVALAAGALIAGLTLVALHSTWAVERVGRMVGEQGSVLRPLPIRATVAGGTLTLASWVTYGIAFWALARGMGFGAGLAVPTAIGVFALGYIAGLLALFAPGGVGVREVAFGLLLAPVIGPGPAVGLSVASRLLLTVMEVAAAGVAVLAGRVQSALPKESSNV
jgi:hypothetical protein